MRYVNSAILFLTVAMSLVACVESHYGESDAGVSQEAEVRAYVDALIRARCARAIHCEARLPSVAWMQAAECHPGSTGVDIGEYDLNAWLEGRTTFHAELASRCLAAIETNCTNFEDESVCAQVFEGVGGVGADCTRVDCDDATYCVTVTESPDACAPTVRECVPRRAEGESCRNYCLGDLLCVDGACRPATPEGESCVLGSSECGRGALCRAGVCGPDSVHVGRGEGCVQGSHCEDGLVCARSNVDEPGVCVDGVGPGDECSGGVPCSLGHRCTDGTCRVISGAGGPCGAEVCAYGFWCDGGSCAPQPMLDERCSAASGCATGLCEDGICQAVPQGAACEHPDPAILGSCEFQGCDPEIGVCPTFVGEGEYCDTVAFRCRGLGIGQGLHCTRDGLADGICERSAFFCE